MLLSFRSLLVTFESSCWCSPSFPCSPCSPCYPCSPNLLHVLQYGIAGFNEFCSPANRKHHKSSKMSLCNEESNKQSYIWPPRRIQFIIVQSNLGGYLGLYLGVSLVQVINSILVLLANFKETYQIDEKCDFWSTLFSCYFCLVGRRFPNCVGLFLLLKEKRIGRLKRFGAGIRKIPVYIIIHMKYIFWNKVISMKISY